MSSKIHAIGDNSHLGTVVSTKCRGFPAGSVRTTTVDDEVTCDGCRKAMGLSTARERARRERRLLEAKVQRLEALVSEIEKKLFFAHCARIENACTAAIRAAINRYREERAT
ncbi:MAG TPA: hypothetical protein VHB02_06155 [Acidimicrobiales bacterium]|nr:hypothetical protein [Acidimicrobiales bacterium]